MTIQYLWDRNLIVFETISGSNAYGTSPPTSDANIRGVFILPPNQVSVSSVPKGLEPATYLWVNHDG